MRKLLFLFILCFSFSFAQGDCEDCVVQGGFYCGDDESNWTQYSPNGCVQAGWINDGWLDCVDGSDENGAVATTDCDVYGPEPCDTVYVEIPVVEYIYETDTIVEIQVIEEEVFVIDTLYVYEDVLDTMFIDVIEYVEIFVIDTIIEIEYMPEYIDCDTGMPCSTRISEIIESSKQNNIMYNLLGVPILRPKGVYIQGGKIKYRIY